MANEHDSAKRPAQGATAVHRSSKRLRYDYNNIIAVLVGVNELELTVHKDVICAKSKFFRAACSGRWREGVQRIVRLPEVRQPDVFQMYVDWTYTEDLVFQDQTSDTDVLTELIELHLLGDILDDVKLRNMTIHFLTSQVATTDGPPCFGDIDLIWEHTTPSSSLRRWALDTLVALLGADDFEKYITEYPAELTQQISIKLMRKASGYTVSPEEYIATSHEYMESVDDD
ncbi:hypothetical protein Q7P35_008633 [Cladosporium inversicolor]